MQHKSVLVEVGRLLDEWDPLEILQRFKPIDYGIDALGEYSSYVMPVIQTYLANRPIENYLIQLQTNLWDDPNEEQRASIKITTQKMVSLLSKYSKSDLAELRA
ncbi:hypothetical protein J2I47_00095 [Fibrella sp. HMF5335]|uniref:Uncharacterized protein n=1 Tax=Fibrella rubiginis TaxID=2817060 RepID=A0A939GBV3_9BACT|nr:hypothetical protein [Fibrella rubiginis]MBO0934933.1 hypothetical protein [Fibrella rubiginis]